MERFLTAADETRIHGAATAAPLEVSESKSLEAFGWGILSASSLILGSSIGIVKLPSKVVRAALMAFGGGALIEALSIELFAHILATARGGHGQNASDEIDRPLVFLAIGAALAGGLIFTLLDRILAEHGAFVRKTATLRSYVGRLRYALTRRIIARLRLVPMFEVLPTHQLHRLARCTVKERHKTGAVIFSELDSGSSLFFLLSGRVELTITTRYTDGLQGQLLGAEKDLCEVPFKAEEVQDIFMVGPNDIFGEMALFTSETLQMQAVAASPCTVLRIPSATVHSLLASNGRLQEFVAMTTIDRLRETEVFRLCTPSTVARLVSFMRQAEFETGDVLFYDIDDACPIYFVVLGSVEVICPLDEVPICATDATADTHPYEGGVVRTVCANELLGTEHLVHGRHLHRIARATERTTVLIIQRSDIDKLCERDERFRQSLIRSADSVGFEDVPEVNLVPPEGVAPPSKFGCAAFEDLGWKRQRSKDTAGSDTPMKSLGSPARSVCSELEQEQDRVSFIEINDPMTMGTMADLEDLQENEFKANHSNASDAGSASGHTGRGAQAAIMIWLGILIDGVPESVVMGILVNTGTGSSLLTFVCGVFLANFPEAMSSAGTMAQYGMKRSVIMVMWSSITIMTGIGAFIGASIFPPGSETEPGVQKAIAGIEGLCGGAMLCMIANTVLPEAFEQGGNVTGLSALLGFLVAISVSVIEI